LRAVSVWAVLRLGPSLGAETLQGVLMGGDVAPDRYEEPKGFSLSLQINSTTEAERIFNELGKGGRVAVPLEKTFWAARFGMLVDRFGIPWLINCDGPDQTPEG
jgi:PhnB protein